MEFFLQLLFPSWALELLRRRWGLISVNVAWPCPLHTVPSNPLPTCDMVLEENTCKEGFLPEKVLGSPLCTQRFVGHCQTIPGGFYPFVSAWKYPLRAILAGIR